MNRYFILLILTLFVSCTSTGPLVNIPGYRLKYDHHALRTPGNKFAIGLVIPADGKTPQHTIGYSGEGGWGKYHVDIDSGSFSGGNVKLRDSKRYKKGDSMIVNVYHRKWFLGGRGTFLTSRKIPYNYEDSILLLTNSNTGRFPGGHIKFGVRSIYNNHQSSELWYPVKKKNRNDFLLDFDGGHLSKSKGDWKIDPDPTHINNDEVSLFARLTKNPAISDTLRLLLDYKAAFRCNIRSSDQGHDLNVTVDAFDDAIIHQKLMSVELHDNTTQRVYRYLINTDGGSMNISSMGADGANGDNGQAGYNGRPGDNGEIVQVALTVRDTKGKDSTIYQQTQGPGGDGEDGGSGTDGENGYNGYDGGNITVYYTPAAADWLKMISTASIPGSGGYGGSGGPGGNGGNGGIGSPSGRPGRQGPSGINGANGSEGRLGLVRFVPM